MPGSNKPQDAASMRNLNADTAVIRAKARTYPIRREPGRDARLHPASPR